MDELTKLHHLLEHWAEHNTEHEKTYRDWAKKAESLGKRELAAVLTKIAEDTSAMDGLFKKALGLC